MNVLFPGRAAVALMVVFALLPQAADTFDVVAIHHSRIV